MTDMTEPRFCTNCGRGVSGKFCAYCGAEVRSPPAWAGDASWGSVATDFLAEAPANSVMNVALGFARAPVSTAMRLTDLATYNGQWRFLFTALAVYFTTFQVVINRVLAKLQNTPVADNRWEFVVQQVTTVSAIIVIVPIMYYACRALSRVPRQPRKYLKLAVLCYGYWYLLDTALTLAWMTVAVVLAFGLKAAGHGETIGWLTKAMTITGILIEYASVLVLTALMNRRFWRLGWIATIGVAVGYLIMTQIVVFPALVYAVNASDFKGWLKQIFG